ncbi:MAG: carbon-nitrogen hydrolase family protein [Planctomycetales bacterium]|jgi:predicted amidohydrolase|nr:carbon-nitrogen hydrolase family protein [Planctomycetales bacterium]
MRIGHCQLDSQLGDFKGNLGKVLEGLKKADADRVDIACFPECFLTGYPDDGDIARRDAFSIDSPQIMQLLDQTAKFEVAFIVGFNELRGSDLYNTAVVVHKGHLLGHYSKCTAYMKFHRQGREFPVFEHKGLKFGVVICSDGGYIEPSRLLALQGAKVIFAPHFNYISQQGLIGHFMHVRADHTARAVENMVYFVRGNNVSMGKEECINGYDGVGYGDSYIIDPWGEIMVRSRRQQEDFIFADIDTNVVDRGWSIGRSMWSAREFGEHLRTIVEKSTKPE